MIKSTCGIEFGWWKNRQPLIKWVKRGGFRGPSFGCWRLTITFWLWS